ncbi:MAG: hypothetical protein QG650_552 [Patescibacteria group bacterium]|nr:hypothetical protein [Patescibacteria group bacterium]
MNLKLPMSISPAFLQYFEKEFFAEDSRGFEDFRKSLLRPLKKTIRLNPNRPSAETFRRRKTTEGWTFTPTQNPTAFRVDREDVSTAL